jgi:ubiquinone/menaquinone biosynthesis C-methylase UbiE
MDAAHIVDLVPSNQGIQYVVLDNACGTGAAVEWLVNEFAAQGLELDITATDYSAVMMNEVTSRRERLNWGKNIKSFIMDAQVPPNSE